MTQQEAPHGDHRQGRPCLVARIVCTCAVAVALFGPPALAAEDAPRSSASDAAIAVDTGLDPEPLDIENVLAPDTENAPAPDAERTSDAEAAMTGLRGRLVQGGWVMVALLGCSLLVVAVAIERVVATRRSLVWPAVLQALVDRTDGVDRDALRVQVKEPASVGGRLVRAGLRAEENGIADVTGVVAEIGAREVARLRRGLPLLANLANIATMLGLFGTVLGMIDAFELIAAQGTGDPRVVADGIFKALVTTAAGLAIGIAALAIHALLSGRVDGRIRELEDGLGAIFDPASSPAAPPARPPTRASSLASPASSDAPSEASFRGRSRASEARTS